MQKCFKKDNLHLQIFRGLLGLPVAAAGQIIIKETIDFGDAPVHLKTSVSSAAEPPFEHYRQYFNQTGRLTLNVPYYYWYRLRGWELHEESLGKIAEGGSALEYYYLGEFPQWQGFTFFYYHPESGTKRYASSSKAPACNFGVGREADGFTSGYTSLSFPNLGRLELFLLEADSSRASLPPQWLMDCAGKNVTTPEGGYTSLGEARWGYAKILRATPGAVYDLYLASPEERLLAADVGGKIRESFRLGPYAPHDTLSFYITSSHPEVAGMKLYGLYRSNRPGRVNFEGWTDLSYDDVEITIEDGLMPTDPNGINITSLPEDIMYGDTAYVEFEGDLGYYGKFPEDQEFDVWIDERHQQYGTLVSRDGSQRGTYLEGVREPVLFISKTIDEIGFEPSSGFRTLRAKTTLQAPYPPYEIDGWGSVIVKNQVLKVSFASSAIAPGQKTEVRPYFEYRDGERQYFPEDHTFLGVAIVRGREYGHLETAGGENVGDGAYGLSPGFKFVAERGEPGPGFGGGLARADHLHYL